MNQEGHDNKVTALASAMNDVFAFVHGVDCLKTIEKHRKSVVLLIQQMTECSYFVAEYTKRKNFCELQSCLSCSQLITCRDSSCKIYYL